MLHLPEILIEMVTLIKIFKTLIILMINRGKYFYFKFGSLKF